MTTTNRDQLIRAALAPRDDLVVPADLGEQIHARLVETPQRSPGLAGLAGPFRRFIPETPLLARPAVVWLTALLLLILALITVIGVASRLEPSVPLSVTSYHGRPAQDGFMPGPGPAGVPIVIHDIELAGSMNNLSVPLVRDEVVYFAHTRGGVAARGATDLSELWTKDGLPHGAEAPVLLGPLLVVAGEDGTITGLDAATGDERWTRQIGGAVEAPLTGVDDRVLVGSSGGKVVVLSSADGQVIHEINARGPVKRSPAIADGTAYIAADSGVVTAFDIMSGEVDWMLDLAADDSVTLSEPEVSTPAYSDGMLYVVRGPFDMSAPHEVVAIDVSVPAVRWRATSPTRDRLFVGAVTDAAVITVGEDGAIRRLDLATGAATPYFNNTAAMGALPTIVGDTLYVSSSDGVVRALDLGTAVEHWSVQVRGQPTMPVVVDGRVYVGTDVGRAVLIGDPGSS